MMWRKYKLGDLAHVQTGPFGSQLHAHDYQETGIPVIMPVNIGDNTVIETNIARISESMARTLDKHYTKEGDIVYSRRGDITRKAYISKKEMGWLCGTGCLKVSPNHKIANPKFISYALGTDQVKDYLLSNAVGTTMPNLNTSILSSLDLLLPDLPTQTRIAEILSSLDDKIELNRRMNQTLEAIAQTLFKEWFVNFNFPDENGQPYRDSGGKLVDSELGAIPEDWRVGHLLEIANLLSGGTPKTSVAEYWDGTIKWISAKDVTANHGSFIIVTEKMVTAEGINNSSAKLLPSLTTVVSARGTVGNFCLLPESMAISQSNYGLKSKMESSDFYLYLLIGNLVERMKQHAYGTVFDTITTKTFQEMRIVIPTKELMQTFNNKVASLFETCLVNLNQSQSLIQLRDCLLPKLMRGELLVSQVEELVEETLSLAAEPASIYGDLPLFATEK